MGPVTTRISLGAVCGASGGDGAASSSYIQLPEHVMNSYWSTCMMLRHPLPRLMTLRVVFVHQPEGALLPTMPCQSGEVVGESIIMLLSVAPQ